MQNLHKQKRKGETCWRGKEGKKGARARKLRTRHSNEQELKIRRQRTYRAPFLPHLEKVILDKGEEEKQRNNEPRSGETRMRTSNEKKGIKLIDINWGKQKADVSGRERL